MRSDPGIATLSHGTRTWYSTERDDVHERRAVLEIIHDNSCVSSRARALTKSSIFLLVDSNGTTSKKPVEVVHGVERESGLGKR